MPKYDPVHQPKHYQQLNGFEGIEVAEQFNFCLGSAIKYIIRCNHKVAKKQDLEKAIWFLNREIDNIKKDD